MRTLQQLNEEMRKRREESAKRRAEHEAQQAVRSAELKRLIEEDKANRALWNAHIRAGGD